MPAGERALRHADAAALLASERADPERVGLHLLRTEPAREAATVATLRDAARRATARGAPRRPRRPTCAARSPSRRRRRGGSRRPARARPRARRVLAARRLRAAARGGRRRRHPGPAGHDRAGRRTGARPDRAFRPASRSAARRSSRPGPTRRNCASGSRPNSSPTACCTRRRSGSRGATCASAGRTLSALELWRVTAAARAMFENHPAAQNLALLARCSSRGAGRRAGSLVVGPMVILIAEDELDTALAQCDALIDFARPRGWLIALAHGCMFRAMALIRAGEIRDAEPDARLAFEYKLPVARAGDALEPVLPGRRARRGRRPGRRRRGADRRWPAGRRHRPARSPRRCCWRAARGCGSPSTGREDALADARAAAATRRRTRCLPPGDRRLAGRGGRGTRRAGRVR